VFRRSSVFGIVGVLVVAGACAAVALTLGQPEDDPKPAYALIFAIIGVYLILLFALQSADVRRAERADADAESLEPAAIENPATLNDATLWASMAVRPIDADARRARGQIWATTRGSIRTGMLVCALIFLTVPPIYLLETFVPLIVGFPLIAGVAVWKSVRLMGGGIDAAYESAGRAMAPLGLRIEERPAITIEAKGVAPLRMGTAMHGALVLEGERHGRHVLVTMPADRAVRTPSEVLVDARVPDFEMRSRDGRVNATDGAPPEVVAALKRIRGSTRWNGVRGGAEDGRVVVRRKSAGASDWLLDLWLAERIADEARG
jgi:hypothetical protein